MTRGQLDDYDLVLMPVFLLGSLFSLDLLSVGSLPLIGDPSAPFTTIGSVDVSVAVVLSLVSLLGVFYTNEWSIREFNGGIQFWTVIATFGLVIAPPFAPSLDASISGGVGSLFALTIQSTGYSILSYLG